MDLERTESREEVELLRHIRELLAEILHELRREHPRQTVTSLRLIAGPISQQ